MALQPGKARNAGHRPGGPRGQNDSIGREIPGQRLHGQLVGVGQAHGLGGDELHPHGLGTLDAPAFQLDTGDGFGKAVVVLDELGPGQGARALGQNGGLHPARAAYNAAETPAGPEPMMTMFDMAVSPFRHGIGCTEDKLDASYDNYYTSTPRTFHLRRTVLY